jgi:hypothetical protein
MKIQNYTDEAQHQAKTVFWEASITLLWQIRRIKLRHYFHVPEHFYSKFRIENAHTC